METFGLVSSHNREMMALEIQLPRLSQCIATILLQGESGVGKDVMAQRIHQLSQRSGAYVALNAATLAPTLAASELFGYVAGAFTGAYKDHFGAFFSAAGGTLFLDEIAELPMDTQAELLRTLENRCVRRVGEAIETPVDVRLIVATHHDLAAAVLGGRFREDLYHRVAVLPLTIPPLRDRREDIMEIAQEFLRHQVPARVLSRAAQAKLEQYHWPGNIRELLNVLRRACILSEHLELNAEDLCFTAWPTKRGQFERALQTTVRQAYREHSGNVKVVAQTLGLRRSTVYQCLRWDRN